MSTHHSRTTLVRCVSFFGSVAAALTIGTAAASAAVHNGEDGKTYILEAQQDRSHWLLGKIDPALLDYAAKLETVNVSIYIARENTGRGAADPVEAVKARYQDQFDSLADQMRGIWNRYRPAESIPEDEEKQFVRQRGAVSGKDRSALNALQVQHDELRASMHKEIGTALEEAGRDERRIVSDHVAAVSGVVQAEVAMTNVIAATVPSRSLQELAEHPLVIAVVLDPDTQIEMDVSVPSAGFDDWHTSPDGPFLGGAYDFGIVDTGVQEDHPGFSNVDAFFSNFAGTDNDSHGTHCTGIVANNNTTYVYGGPYTGTATDLDAIIWGVASNTQTTTMARMDDLMTDFVQSPEVINHSLGYSSTGGVPSGPVSSNDYVNNDSFYDAFVRNYDVQVTKSAGNSGWGGNATMTFPANAYNLMVVANMDDQNTLTRSDDVRRTSSSVGPTRNGRRKPDITAPGSNIISTNAFWNTGFGDTPEAGCAGNGTDMCTKSGTSMAAPHIAGAIILQHDAGNLSARAQKATLINTADWWTSAGTSGTGDDGQVFSQTCSGGFDPCVTPWDRSYGWGYVDMSELEFNRSDYFVDSIVPNNDTAVEDDYELYRGQMFTNEKATLVWDKRADTYVPGGTAGGQRVLSDINLRLYKDSDGTLMDGDFVGNDNVHQVAANSSGQAVIKVYAWSTSFDGAGSETFALATEENFSRVNPPSFAALPLIPVVGPFQTFVAPTQVSNNGSVSAHDVNVSIGNIAGVSGDGTSQGIGTLADGDSQQVDFTLTTSGLGAGTYSIGVTVSSDSYDETYSNTTGTGVQFVVETTAPTSTCSSLPEYRNNTQISVPWTASDGIFGTGVGDVFLYVAPPSGGPFQWTGLAQSGTSGTFNYTMAAGDGIYRFAVAAEDLGGNWEGTPTSSECATQLDTVTPVAVASTPANVLAGPIPISWTWSDASPSSGIEFVDLWYYAEPAGPWTYTGLFSFSTNGVLNWAPPGPGTYHFFARGKDNAQNFEIFPPVPGDSTTVYGNIVDSDGDGIADNLDNCIDSSNADQRDTNGDGYGNICDADLDNNCVVAFPDLGIMKSVFFTNDADADLDGNGTVSFSDLSILKAAFFGAPGPSGVTDDCD